MRRKVHPRPQVTDDVPDVLKVGCLIEVWSATGDPHASGTAYQRHVRARLGWCRWHGLDTAGEMATLGPSSGPWSLSSPCGTRRLADLGYSPDDVTWLRVAAEQHDTDPPTPRSTR